MSKGGYVYAIGIENTALVKIGVARGIGRRLAVLQSATPYKLILLHHEHVEEPRRVEHTLHAILARLRERGEWFDVPDLYFPSLFAAGRQWLEHEKDPHEHALDQARQPLSLGKQIQKARVDKGWKQQDLRTATGISQKHLSKIENDEVDLGVAMLRRLCTALEVSPNYLLEWGTNGEAVK